MTIGEKLELFCNDIKLDSTEAFDTSIKEITKKLNKEYYDSNSEKDNSYIVGSIGRKTAMKDVSDVDMIFNLPDEVFRRFDSYKDKKQTSLLQEIKNILTERYPTTDISADGQVVVIAFTKYTIELVPAFLQEDNTFKYPDTNDGGSWKITKPFQEQDESINTNNNYNGLFARLANILRCWKNNVGFKFGGLLIDTLVYKFLREKEEYKTNTFEELANIIQELFSYLKKQDKEQEYWFALGSNQKVYNTGNGRFVNKASKAFNKIDKCENNTELEDVYIELFGTKFSDCIAENRVTGEQQFSLRYQEVNYNEEFIEDRYPVDIRYNLKIECEIKQDGWRPALLQDLLDKFGFLRPEKELKFYISQCDVIGSYKVFWKIRNCGEEAYRRNDIRGQITKDDGTKTHNENSKFRGHHYAECYIVKNGICVARDRIDVPISN